MLIAAAGTAQEANVTKSTGSVPAEGQAWSVPDLGMEVVFVHPGTFQMGSTDNDDDEKPVHMVLISRGFWMGKYEVTQTEYEAVVGVNPSSFKGARNPVELVSWTEAVAFCAKLSERERAAGRLPAGYEYRLPTEAEWEYAARGGAQSGGYTYSGSSIADEVAWYGDNSDASTHPVGQKKANELGLYDMGGNVWESCLDGYDEKYYGCSPSVDPANTRATPFRVWRGGSWLGASGGVRLANRLGSWPDNSYNILGVRACLAPVIALPSK
jgi:formylglycine-generating enzyme required for sulfatase activity